MGTFRTALVRAVAVSVLFTGAAVAPAAGATRSWVGGVGNGEWSEPTNWNPAVAPVDGDDLIFPAGGTAVSLNDLASLTVNSIDIQADHEIIGNPFVVTAGITASAVAQLRSTITLGGVQTWNMTASSNVAEVALNGQTWTIDNTTPVDINLISGAGAIVKQGAGVARLWEDNSFSGPFTISAGIVEAYKANSLGIADQTPENGTTVAAGASLNVMASPPYSVAAEALTLQGTGVANSGALRVQTTGAVTFTGPIELAATTHVLSGAGTTIIFNGPVKGPGDLFIVGQTVAVFANANNTVPYIGFDGPGGGVARVGVPNALANTRIELWPDKTLDVNNSFTEVLGLAGGGMVWLGGTAGTLTVKNTLPSSFSGPIGGPGGTLIKEGPGTLTLSGASIYGGQTFVNAGTLRVTSAGALGTGDGTIGTGTTVAANATLALDNVELGERILLTGTTQPAMLQVMGTNPSVLNGPLVTTQQAAITGTDGATLTLNGLLTIGSPATITNARVLVMNSTTNSIAGPVTIDAGGMLEGGIAGAFNPFTEIVLNGGTFNIDGRQVNIRRLAGNGVLAFGTGGGLMLTTLADSTFAGTSTGTGALLKAGIGALTLSGPLTVTGNVTVQSGTLVIAHDQAVVTTPRISVSAGAALVYTVAATVPYQVGFFGSGTTGLDGAVQVLGGNVTFTGLFAAGAYEGMVRVNAPHVMTWTGTMSTPSLNVVGSGTAVIAGAGHFLLDLRIGVTPLTNTAAGPTTVRAGAADALSGLHLYVHTGSTFDLNGFDHTISMISGGGTIAIGAQTLTLTGSPTFEGILTGTGTIDASGHGLHVMGVSTFTGSVMADNFLNGGTLPASVHVIGSSMTLLPNSVTGPVSVAADTFLIAGDETTAAGVTTGNLNLPAGASLTAILHTTSITVNGTVTLAGSLGPSIHPGLTEPGNVLTLIDNDGADPIAGTFVNVSEGQVAEIAGHHFRYSYVGGDGNDLTLTKMVTTYYLSEGATGAFFDTDLLIANPNDAIVDVGVEFHKEGGAVKNIETAIGPFSRMTLRVDNLQDLESAAFSTIVRSRTGALPLIVERTMRWDATGYGAHTEKATTGPALTWYFAEGSEGSFFRTYLLLANPDSQPNVATVTYLREGDSSITRTYEIPALSRRTIQAADDPELVDRSFGMTVSFAQRGIAERAMYFGTSPIWKGGHESLGETSPSTTWLLAEGATGGGFDTFVLVANPNADPVDVTYTFLSDSASPATITRTIGGLSRHTVNIEAEGLSLPDGPVATRIEATQPVIAERAQYWPLGPDRWTEAHNSFGVTEPALKWGLAEGRAGGPEHYQTYILLANAGTEDARVQLQFLPHEDSTAPQTMTVDVPAQRRVNVPVDPTGGPDDPATQFGVVITSDKPIVVERAMYWDANGEVWAAGTNATATRLP